jgi:hypothetical protein
VATIRKIPATLNSVDQQAIEKYIREWRYQHGEPQQCVAHWEVREDGKVRWFPAKVIDLYFRDAHGQVRLNSENGEMTVSKHPNDKQQKPSLDRLDLDCKPDTPTYGLTPMMEKAA